MSFHVPNQYRLREGDMGSTDRDGNNGAFMIPPTPPAWRWFAVVASDGLDWENVAVHMYRPSRTVRNYTPTWEEMCSVKALFWDPEDVVVQFHPSESARVNVHHNTLHLWRPIGAAIPMPPVETV